MMFKDQTSGWMGVMVVRIRFAAMNTSIKADVRLTA